MSDSKSSFKLGGHCYSDSEIPLSDTIKECKKAGWSCLQTFLGDSNDFKNRRVLITSDRKKCITECADDNDSFRVYTHFPYNMSLVKKKTKFSMKGLQDEINTLSAFGGRVVIHPNSPDGTGNLNKDNVDEESDEYIAQYRNAIDIMIENLKLLSFPELQGNSEARSDLENKNAYSLLLEPPANEGRKIGGTFSQIKYITKQLIKNNLSDKVGFCIDTCHSHAAGLSEFDTEKSVNKFFNRLDRYGTLPLVKCVHLNDSQTKFGSRIDRHESLCKGYIWEGKEEGFIAFVRKCRQLNIDIICETAAIQGVPLCFMALEDSDNEIESEVEEY